jgi:hypothetical protein
VIIELGDPQKGELEIRTIQGSESCRISEIGIEPIVWQYGGLRKKLEAYRLPADNEPQVNQRKLLSFELQLTKPDMTENQGPVASDAIALKKGCNPLYICVVQEDGHRAWTSPVYVMCD